MHEASVARDVLEIIMDNLNNDKDLKCKKIKSVRFAQSFPPTVAADSFEFYFTELVRETVLDGAELEFSECEEHGFFITSIEVD